MINNLKLTNLIIVCFLFYFSSFGQNDKLSISIEVSPNISKITNDFIGAKSKLSFNGLVRLEYKSNELLSPTIGIGYLNTGEKSTSAAGGQFGLKNILFSYIHNYLIIPLGAKFQLGKFYLHPEIGPGFNLSNKTVTTFNYSNGDREKEIHDSVLNTGEYNKVSVPMFLSFGREFNLGDKVFLVGLKGYYSFNKIVKDVPRNSHYYGLGFLLGLKF